MEYKISKIFQFYLFSTLYLVKFSKIDKKYVWNMKYV